MDSFLGHKDASIHSEKLNPEHISEISGSSIVIANNMLCFFIQGLSTSIRIPVAYSFSKQLCGKNLHTLTLSVLKEVEAIGFIIVRIVSDNHKKNVRMMTLLAGGKPWPVIPHPLDDQRKLFLSFDPSHVIKNIRNFFFGKRNANKWWMHHQRKISLKTLSLAGQTSYKTCKISI